MELIFTQTFSSRDLIIFYYLHTTPEAEIYKINNHILVSSTFLLINIQT